MIEFGAGQRQLEKLLDENCIYIPSDLVARGPNTIICDLNEPPLPDLRNCGAKIAVFGGVLEYVKDVSAVARWLTEIGIEKCVASFDAAPAKPSFVGWTRERLRRLYFGYMNNLTEAQFLQCFESAGMICREKHRWTTQLIYRFDKGV
ncbi:hypothetical protein AYO49_01040 [Verrucomicrobiaceae bacterium SCGC AG-212-N21]|nr:hypothetical protein AYO49_01040 [Verrucomicrobiaceae bacterium SCGC AG-212-N21]